MGLQSLLDGDGVGNNADLFDNDPNEWADTGKLLIILVISIILSRFL